MERLVWSVLALLLALCTLCVSLMPVYIDDGFRDPIYCGTAWTPGSNGLTDTGREACRAAGINRNRIVSLVAAGGTVLTAVLMAIADSKQRRAEEQQQARDKNTRQLRDLHEQAVLAKLDQIARSISPATPATAVAHTQPPPPPPYAAPDS